MEGHEAHNQSAHAGHSGMELKCDGSVSVDGHGTWKGHVYPGAVFILWGAWWAYNAIAGYLWQTSRRPYRGRSWHPLAVRWLWYLEPALKLLLPPAAVAVELLLDHHMTFQYLYCPKGTKFEGRFSLIHMNNWQHTASYPAFFLSGLVDFAGLYVPLPAGTSQAVLGCAFGVMTFLMGTHEKHEPQDKMVHWLLFLSMALCTALVFLEMVLRRALLAGVAKALGVVFLGAWLVQVAVVEFADHPQWSHDYPGGAMFAPVAFCLIFVAALAAMLALYILLALLKQHSLLRCPPLVYLEQEADQDREQEQEQDQEAVKPTRGLHLHQYDSANHSDDTQGLLEPPARHTRSGSSTAVTPFHITHTRGSAARDSADGFV